MKKLMERLKSMAGRKRVKTGGESAQSVVYITDTLLAETGRLIASFAEGRESEGVVYWFGFELGGRAVVTTLIVPDADTSHGCISTSPEANGEALGVIVGTPLVLLGQAHSHPGERVRHSPVDDRETFARFDGGLSVVIPHFARRGVDLSRCGVHRHVNGAFKFIRPERVGEHVVVVPGQADLRREQEGRIRKEKANVVS
ncbi:MAG: hypothetical protein LC803_22100 [Acidobacteria bacterium]|nr:hypothetical protein [Acidobacteriota bacterium]